MNFLTNISNGCQVLTIQDERIDAHNADDLKTELLQCLERHNGTLIVELANVRFIDSSGLGALLSGYKHAEAKAGKLILSNIQPAVLAMFEITRLNRVFEIYANLDDALTEQS